MFRAGLLPAVVLLSSLSLSGCAVPGSAEPAADPRVAPERQIIVAVHNDAPRLQHRAGSTSRPYQATGAYRVSLQSRKRMAEISREYDLRPLAGWPITLLDLYCVVFELPEGSSREEILAGIAAAPGVVLAQAMQEFSTLSGGSQEPSAGAAHNLDAMGIPDAHAWAQGRGIKVALIDTGLDRNHPGLEGRVLSELDFAGRRVLPAEEEAHGLAVAGVIVARPDTESGMVGVAPEAKLLALRACWHTDPVNAVCNSFTLARAISAAVDRRADIINLSLTGPPDPLLERLLLAAMKRNAIVVGAAPPIGPPGFPTEVAGVIPVRSAEQAGAHAGQLLAPGRDIFTLRPGGGYELADGSSLAAAHISGVVALLLEHRADLGGDEIHELLAGFTEPVVRAGGRNFRVVNACRALASLIDGHCPENTVRPESNRIAVKEHLPQ